MNIPFGEDTRYDVIVDTPQGLRRVQIKTCTKPNKRGRFKLTVNYGRSPRKSYTAEDCDFVAAYVVPLESWWIIPIDKVKTTTIDIGNQHQESRSAWHNICYEKPRARQQKKRKPKQPPTDK